MESLTCLEDFFREQQSNQTITEIYSFYSKLIEDKCSCYNNFAALSIDFPIMNETAALSLLNKICL
jgi:hypothetical protein